MYVRTIAAAALSAAISISFCAEALAQPKPGTPAAPHIAAPMHAMPVGRPGGLHAFHPNVGINPSVGFHPNVGIHPSFAFHPSVGLHPSVGFHRRRAYLPNYALTNPQISTPARRTYTPQAFHPHVASLPKPSLSYRAPRTPSSSGISASASARTGTRRPATGAAAIPGSITSGPAITIPDINSCNSTASSAGGSNCDPTQCACN
jgi:hypothetical protein